MLNCPNLLGPKGRRTLYQKAPPSAATFGSQQIHKGLETLGVLASCEQNKNYHTTFYDKILHMMHSPFKVC